MAGLWIIFSVLIGAFYALLFFLFAFGFWRLKRGCLAAPSDKAELLPYVSFIIPFRNEARNLPSLLQSLSALDYPHSKIDLIFVNDHSEDGGKEIVQNFADRHTHIRLFDLPDERRGKKAALSYGLQHAKHEIIATADADTTFGPEMLSRSAGVFVRENFSVLLLPVFMSETSAWKRFQAAEFMTLIASAAGSAGIGMPILSNGAGMLFRKALAKDLNAQFASGDDMFILHAAKAQTPGKIGFLPDVQAAVTTEPAADLKTFWQQRTRWVSKFRGYSDIETSATGVLVFGMNILLLTGFILSFFDPYFWWLTLYLFLMKFIPDGLLVIQAFRHFEKSHLCLWFILWVPLYPFYALFSVLGGLLRNKVVWKNRLQ